MVFQSRRARAKERAQNTLLEIAKQGRVLPATVANAHSQFISLPALDIPGLAAAYAEAMEMQETNDWCRCEWVVHPDDVEVKSGHCRQCGTKKNDPMHWPTRGDHEFRGKRMRRGDQAEDCPVHTKEGMLIYFFEWVFTRGKS